MARIRSVKPDYWHDHRLACDLNRDQRLFYIGLWTEADDEGRFLAHPRRLLGAIFPYDEDLPADFVRDTLAKLHETGRVLLYEVNGEPYAQLTKFKDHQRISHPTPSRIPSPPSPETRAKRSRKNPEASGVRVRAGGKEGIGKEMEQGSGEEGDAPPQGWKPNETHYEIAKSLPGVLVAVEAEKFRDYNASKGRRLKDMDAGFRNWLRKAGEWKKPVPHDSPAANVSNETPQAATKRSGDMSRAGATEAAESIDDARVIAWRGDNPEQADTIWRECAAEVAGLPGAAMFGEFTARKMADSRFRSRVLAEYLTPRLAG